MTESISLELVTRRECGLCDEMKLAIEDAIGALGSPDAFELVEVDVDEDPDLLERYGEHVPVLLVGGVEAFRHRAEASSLLARLREAAGH